MDPVHFGINSQKKNLANIQPSYRTSLVNNPYFFSRQEPAHRLESCIVKYLRTFRRTRCALPDHIRDRIFLSSELFSESRNIVSTRMNARGTGKCLYYLTEPIERALGIRLHMICLVLTKTPKKAINKKKRPNCNVPMSLTCVFFP